ncbi:NUDIX hydrolase [Phytohalomonas tamaricis]|uniref:NUDIX hydrolase n=1 Tax=Phytohalomonas tamaricis TaxID=2081032 RepID=UPI000D0BA984|nr:NUDIX domain-containing protein [Phytohalomonas tamaricis]
MSPGQELIQITDANNRPCGATTRARMRRLKLWHRATYIFVSNRQGQLCVQRRTMSKDIFPGGFDLAAGGVVDAGEDMHSGARRELGEELGIYGVPLRHCFDFRYVDADLHVHGGVFMVRYDGPLILQASEVAGIEWLSPEQVLGLDNVTPDSRRAFERLLKESWLASSPPSKAREQVSAM